MDRRTFLAMLGAAGVTVGLTAPLGPAVPAAHAADGDGDPTAGRAPHQPYMHGYDAAAIKSWSPGTDRFARYFRSRVPLAPRIAPFAATQADPRLVTGPQVMNLTYDYDNSFFTAYKYDNVFSRRLLRFWQYSDLYGSWHGLPVDGSPVDAPVHGLINLPNPAWTDAAHRNGVRSLGCWFWPRPGHFADYLERRPDGSFPVADQLTRMAAYFGFDGYFVNQEAAISPADAEKLMEMIVYWRSRAPKGFHLQWYDTIMVDGRLDYQNQLNDNNAPWIQHAGTAAAHSLFANYWLPDAAQVETSRTTAERLGLDPYQVVFHSTENEKYGYNPPYDPRLIFPEGQPARTSWGLFGSHFVWDRYPDRENPDAQDGVFTRERHYWSGPNEDPTRTGRTEYVPWPDQDDGRPRDADNPKKWDGVAHYITERSVIGAFPFVTRFNTGHGRAFFLAGRRASPGEWNNASIQDILPTWQFWTRSEGRGLPLDVDFDYTRAYDGGSSLRISGDLGPDNPTTLRLFKTALTVRTGGERVRVTHTPTDGGTTLEAVLVFADDPHRLVRLPLATAPAADGSSSEADAGTDGEGDGWRTSTARLSAHRDRTIAAIGLRCASRQRGPYTIHIGELALLPKESAPRPGRPQAFSVDAVHRSGASAEVFLSWRLARSGVWYYDITRDLPGGDREAVGRIYDDVYYVKSLTRAGQERTTELRLEAVAPDGTRGAPATAHVHWD
ncbi:hypothetical protein C3489_17635 [Streptomyces sp. Ru71]|uniref:endo-beta-N-acetylglucosaminidase n=1 Tax=Streptomyces sp. Ru71 TaxID=2080746 RepID=UPI000CDD9C44|nr:twin-arginine translocation signal domain-containing protein [Streptomyces sp. Ru71]POX52522.1 hypothetical protein C3489_17635 [Streptomyces sp. Ru71]